MFKHIIFCTLLLAASPLAVHAGQGTFRETDDVIIVEYSGEADEDVKAVKMAKEQELQQAKIEAEKQRKQAEIDAERQKALIEESRAKKAAREAARNAPGAPREGVKEEDEQ